jgi:signal transduction histidine kinase
LLLLVLLLAVCIGSFTSRFAIPALNYPLSYAPFPFVIWAALRFGSRGASASVAILSTIAIFGTSLGQGPFSRYGEGQSMLLLQVFLMVVCLTALFLAAAVAERRSAEQELRLSREQLRALSDRLVSAREDERTIVAREVHDELGQQLTGIKMGLSFLARKLPPGNTALSDKTSSLTRLTEEAVQTVRKIARDLRPGILDDLGIISSMHWLCEEYEERLGIPVRFSTNVEDLSTTNNVSTALFRILQEALTNVARHAEASKVRVVFEVSDNVGTLQVLDDGKGVESDPLAKTRSVGLIGMRERAELLGGKLRVSTPGLENRGTSVQATVPLGEQITAPQQ